MEPLRLRKMINSIWCFQRLVHGLVLMSCLHKVAHEDTDRVSFQALYLGLGVHHKLPSDYTYCASYIVGKHQINFRETNSVFQYNSWKTRLAFDWISARQLKHRLENAETQFLFLTATGWLCDSENVAHLLYAFHFPIWESWCFILG